MFCTFCDIKIQIIIRDSEKLRYAYEGINITGCPICNQVVLLCLNCYLKYIKSNQFIRDVLDVHNQNKHTSVELVE